MIHLPVNAEKLARSLKQAAGRKTVGEIAKAARIHGSRVSRFLNGDFKRATPVLDRLCKSLGVQVKDYLVDAEKAWTVDKGILASLRRLVGRDRVKMRAAKRLVRCLEELAKGEAGR